MIGRSTVKAQHQYLPTANTHTFHFPASAAIGCQAVLDLLYPLLTELKGVSVEPYRQADGESEGGLVVRTTEHSWSRAARRKGKQMMTPDADVATPADEFFTCVLELSMSASHDAPTSASTLTLATHFRSVSEAVVRRPEDVAARRLAWDGLWLYLLRKVKDDLLPKSAPGRGDTDMT